ncbi:hypothetical protein EUGRSUZ_C00058 [Eucalyptus grandis]|uniref:Uncharacterized protein n=2 Tax=Eucalyptus grandis TaxID=71139 RepID=A0ACC3L8X3_EUCGR|nr:hypothetical protein EUGRSUZ_C00058 [Eucalyptus grandis]
MNIRSTGMQLRIDRQKIGEFQEWNICKDFHNPGSYLVLFISYPNMTNLTRYAEALVIATLKDDIWVYDQKDPPCVIYRIQHKTCWMQERPYQAQ